MKLIKIISEIKNPNKDEIMGYDSINSLYPKIKKLFPDATLKIQKVGYGTKYRLEIHFTINMNVWATQRYGKRWKIIFAGWQESDQFYLDNIPSNPEQYPDYLDVMPQGPIHKFWKMFNELMRQTGPKT
jgi:hypothetical protein